MTNGAWPRRPIEPATTSTEDIQWAFRVLFCREATPDDAERRRLSSRTTAALVRQLAASAEIADGPRRERCRRKRLDPTLVRWAYRLLRFQVIGEHEAQAIAAERGTLLALVDELLEADGLTGALESVAPGLHPGVTMLYSKSMPRSGHHLLAQVLGEYYGPHLSYCEFYGGGDACCHTIPCRQPFEPLLANRIFLQKSHDLKLTDPVDLPGKYIIQYRHPVPRMQSNYDHNRHVTGRPDTLEDFRRFAKAEMTYFIGFWQKWLREPIRDAFVLKYEDLVGQPREALVDLLSFIDPERTISSNSVERGLAMMRVPSTSSQQSGSIKPRDAREYRYFDEGFYRGLEDSVFMACPGLKMPRMFS